MDLTEFIAIACPQQKINRLTAVPWFDIIGHLDFETARNAVIAVKHSQAFVDPSDIIREADRATRRHAHPSERTAAEAIAASSLRELPAAGAVPPTAEYLAARAELDAKMRQRAEQAMITDRQTAARAQDWINYQLSGKLPPDVPFSSEPAPQWRQLPGDPPELRAWLARKVRAVADRIAGDEDP